VQVKGHGPPPRLTPRQLELVLHRLLGWAMPARVSGLWTTQRIVEVIGRTVGHLKRDHVGHLLHACRWHRAAECAMLTARWPAPTALMQTKRGWPFSGWSLGALLLAAHEFPSASVLMATMVLALLIPATC
jgi:hypothetical protein